MSQFWSAIVASAHDGGARRGYRRIHNAAPGPEPIRAIIAAIGSFTAVFVFISLLAWDSASTASSIFTNCMLYVPLGHYILRAMHWDGYSDTTLSSSSVIGSVGGAALAIPFALLLNVIFPDEKQSPSLTTPAEPRSLRTNMAQPVSLSTGFISGALAGPLGVMILKNQKYNDPILDGVHAAWAGALGGIIFWPSIFAVGVVIFGLAKAFR